MKFGAVGSVRIIEGDDSYLGAGVAHDESILKGDLGDVDPEKVCHSFL